MRAFKISCGIIFLKGEKILLGQVTNCSHWDLPKGGINKNETVIECAIRETKEETGFDVDSKDLIDLGLLPYNKSKKLHLFLYNNTVPSTKMLYCKERNGIVELNDFKYIKISELSSYVVPSMLNSIEHALLLLRKKQSEHKTSNTDAD